MKKVKKYFILSLVFIFSLSLTLSFSMEKGKAMMVKKGIERAYFLSPMKIYMVSKNFKNELKITDSQLEKLKKIAYSHAKKMADIRASLQVLRVNLRELLDSKDHDYLKIEKILKTISEKRNLLFIEGLKARDSALSVLNDEQVQKLKELKRSHFKKRFNDCSKENHHNGQNKNRQNCKGC